VTQSLSPFLLSGIAISKTVCTLEADVKCQIVTGYLSPDNYILNCREQEYRKDSICTMQVN